MQVTEENKINFDLSTLTLEELVEVYENIGIFLDFLEVFVFSSSLSCAFKELYLSFSSS